MLKIYGSPLCQHFVLASDLMTIIFCLLSIGLTGIITVDLHSKEIQAEAFIRELVERGFSYKSISERLRVLFPGKRAVDKTRNIPEHPGT